MHEGKPHDLVVADFPTPPTAAVACYPVPVATPLLRVGTKSLSVVFLDCGCVETAAVAARDGAERKEGAAEDGQRPVSNVWLATQDRPKPA